MPIDGPLGACEIATGLAEDEVGVAERVEQIRESERFVAEDVHRDGLTIDVVGARGSMPREPPGRER